MRDTLLEAFDLVVPLANLGKRASSSNSQGLASSVLLRYTASFSNTASLIDCM
jgi:hypothetical protein